MDMRARVFCASVHFMSAPPWKPSLLIFFLASSKSCSHGSNAKAWGYEMGIEHQWSSRPLCAQDNSLARKKAVAHPSYQPYSHAYHAVASNVVHLGRKFLRCGGRGDLPCVCVAFSLELPMARWFEEAGRVRSRQRPARVRAAP